MESPAERHSLLSRDLPTTPSRGPLARRDKPTRSKQRIRTEMDVDGDSDDEMSVANGGVDGADWNNRWTHLRKGSDPAVILLRHDVTVFTPEKGV